MSKTAIICIPIQLVCLSILLPQQGNPVAMFFAGVQFSFLIATIFIELGSMWRRTCTPFS